MSDAERPGRAWIARLRPRAEVDLALAACPRPVVDDAVGRVGAAPVGWAIELSRAVVTQILAEVPDLGGSPGAVLMLRRGNEVTTLRALTTLFTGASAPSDGEATLDGVREFVRRAIPLERVLHGLRVGHAGTTEAFLRGCAELVDPGDAVDELTAVSRELFRYVDDLSDAMIRAYLTEHEIWSTSAAAVRADVVRSLLADATAVDVEDASRTLGYDLRRTHEAVVVWAEAASSLAALRAAAVEVLRARGATATLVVPVASDRLWAWGAVPAESARHPDPWEQIGDSLGRRHLHAAVGTPAPGVVGFRRTHVEAERALQLERVRRAAGRAPRHAVPYGDVGPVALLATDLEAAGELVRRELGGLAERTPAMEALRNTLLHYLDAERSLVEVARRLHVARGTVTYRVRRAREVLGHDLDARRFALAAALRLAEELGDAVLLPPDQRTTEILGRRTKPGPGGVGLGRVTSDTDTDPPR